MPLRYINRKKEDPIDVLAKVGGLDIAGMAGVFLGGAACQIPVVADGFISCVAALCAIRICPAVKDYVITSHKSKEPATVMILEALDIPVFLDCDMCLGLREPRGNNLSDPGYGTGGLWKHVYICGYSDG